MRGQCCECGEPVETDTVVECLFCGRETCDRCAGDHDLDCAETELQYATIH